MDKPVLLDFWAPWCGPCKAMNPILEALEKKLGDRLTIKKVNVDDEPEMAQQYNVRSIPTMVVLAPDEKLRIIGARPLEYLEKEISVFTAG